MRRCSVSARLALAASVGLLAIPRIGRADDTSYPVILQYFEATYSTVESRMADVFAAGYGTVYTPPPGRADSGNQSVGYDQYDRFDLGSAGNPTLYGTENGLKAAVSAAHTAGLDYGIDLVWNHSGFEDTATSGFVASGGYPGMVLSWPGTTDGDYHSAYASGDQDERLAGLVDIDQSKHNYMIRNPVVAGDPQNIPAGTTSLNGRLANVPTASNARFYPLISGSGRTETDENGNPITVYDFDGTGKTAGTAVAEDSTGYLMRNAQWLVQDIGVDMFRLDATKNMPTSILNSFDQAVYGASKRTLLNGTQKQVFAFGEYFEGTDMNALQSVVRKDAVAGGSTVGGNRDTLDFPLFFAMNSNLSNNGYQNDWNNVVNSSFDLHDDGYNNGSQGVKFVSSPDNYGAYLGNVAYAYTLMMPGNAIVYDNAHQFGTGRDFPRDGRGDALGGAYGNAITTLVDLRNRYGRGNYYPRLVEKESFAFERDQSALVLLSNRLDSGYDNRTISTGFQKGQYLVELTGNAASTTADPTGVVPQVLTVGTNGQVAVTFLRNATSAGVTGDGYLVYGLQTPTGTVSLTGVSKVIKGKVPTLQNTSTSADADAYANATTVLSDINVVTGNTMSVTLDTVKGYAGGNLAYRDADADGDNALLKLDGGVDLNGNGKVDNVTPNTVQYGFEKFVDVRTPGYTSVDNNGTYTQSFSTAGLSDGYHYISVIAYRHRSDGGDAVYSDWKDTIYVDRQKVSSTIASFNTASTDTTSRNVIVENADETANSVHVFMDLPATTSDSTVLGMLGNTNSASSYDRDQYKLNEQGVTTGNHVLTVVSYEIDGTCNVQRYAGQYTKTTLGSGFGDLNHNNTYEVGDITGTSYGFENVLYSQNSKFNAAADINGDGKVDNNDLWQLRPTLITEGAPAAVITEARNSEIRRGNINGDGVTDAKDLDYLAAHYGTTSWSLDIAADDGVAGPSDFAAMLSHVFQTVAGDVNLDGKVDISDLGILATNWQKSGVGWGGGDFDESGKVDISDLGVLATHWQSGVSSPSDMTFAQAWASVGGDSLPEPSVAAALLSGFGVAVRRNNRRV